MNESFHFLPTRHSASICAPRSSGAQFSDSLVEKAWLRGERYRPVGLCSISLALLLVLALHGIGVLKSDWQVRRARLESVAQVVTVGLISASRTEPKPVQPARRKTQPTPNSKHLRPILPRPDRELPVPTEKNPVAAAPIDTQSETDSEPLSKPTADAVSGANRPASFDSAYLHNPAPVYPSLSRRLREQGLVLLSVRVSAAGDAAKVTLHRSSGYSRLDRAALQTVKSWRFEPARREGLAISAAVIVPIRFTLEG